MTEQTETINKDSKLIKADEMQHLLDVSEKEYKKVYLNKNRIGWLS